MFSSSYQTVWLTVCDQGDLIYSIHVLIHNIDTQILIIDHRGNDRLLYSFVYSQLANMIGGERGSWG